MNGESDLPAVGNPNRLSFNSSRSDDFQAELAAVKKNGKCCRIGCVGKGLRSDGSLQLSAKIPISPRIR
jgi:hypothetical protein